MGDWARRIRRALPWVTLIATAAGCRDRPAIDLAAARRFEGEWQLTLRIDPTPGPALPPEIVGTVALLPNRAAGRVEDFPGIPLDVGVHDLPLGVLSPGLGAKGVPDVVSGVVGDSVLLVFGPGARRPVRFRGIVRGDSIAGRWRAEQRFGPGYSGSFVMRRR